jgi:hypothetical protein
MTAEVIEGAAGGRNARVGGARGAPGETVHHMDEWLVDADHISTSCATRSLDRRPLLSRALYVRQFHPRHSVGLRASGAIRVLPQSPGLEYRTHAGGGNP